MKIVIASDSFKGSLTSAEVADAVEAGLQAAGGQGERSCHPRLGGGSPNGRKGVRQGCCRPGIFYSWFSKRFSARASHFVPGRP